MRRKLPFTQNAEELLSLKKTQFEIIEKTKPIAKRFEEATQEAKKLSEEIENLQKEHNDALQEIYPVKSRINQIINETDVELGEFEIVEGIEDVDGVPNLVIVDMLDEAIVMQKEKIKEFKEHMLAKKE